MRQKVISLVPPGGSLFETATPFAVWGPHRSATCAIDVHFVACATTAGPLEIEGGLTLAGIDSFGAHVDDADIVVVPTWPITTRPVDDRVVELLRRAHQRGATLVGLCLGAFAVAATGLLDGSAATTHWRQRERFETLHPDIRFEANTLYADTGSIVTSAGSAAALDCCLHVLRRDHGAEAAADVARSLVTAPHRTGAQSQFASAPAMTRSDDALSTALAAAAEDIAAVHTVEDLAALSGIGRRTLERQLRDRMGISPRTWIAEQRVVAACRLLESTDASIEEVAHAAGYGSAPTLRRAMQNHRALTPTAYRATFRPA